MFSLGGKCSGHCVKKAEQERPGSLPPPVSLFSNDTKHPRTINAHNTEFGVLRKFFKKWTKIFNKKKNIDLCPEGISKSLGYPSQPELFQKYFRGDSAWDYKKFFYGFSFIFSGFFSSLGRWVKNKTCFTDRVLGWISELEMSHAKCGGADYYPLRSTLHSLLPVYSTPLQLALENKHFKSL